MPSPLTIEGGRCYPLSVNQEPIEQIRKRFKDEWLLIAVDAVDPSTGEPAAGRLLAHGSNRQDIHEQSKSYGGIAYVVHSGDWPDDLAACFTVA